MWRGRLPPLTAAAPAGNFAHPSPPMLLLCLLLLLPPVFAAYSPSAEADEALAFSPDQLTFNTPNADDHSPQPWLGRDSYEPRHDGDSSVPNSLVSTTMANLREALHVMQTTWFEVWVGNWPSAIDWTRAVIDTHLIATISTLSRALHLAKQSDEGDPSYPTFEPEDVENDINRYFAQSIAYYFGENASRIRNEAYDDILWVVLGWLESVKFIEMHSELHFREPAGKQWHGTQFIAAFAHRARLFYDLAARGWDEQFCGGGMVWNPSLSPYKNAITNELFITASVSMYLYFPGDNNTSPFDFDVAGDEIVFHRWKRYDRVYLQNAIRGYSWLKQSNMTDDKGLYVDGFHISDWKMNGTTCDIRNNMVYTYNQGVLLSGLRALWEATGNTTFLEDGYELLRNVIAATGWEVEVHPGTLRRHNKGAGLGWNGVMEDACDAAGDCSQDAQTFKSIFFHHLTLFCEPLPSQATVPSKTYAADEALVRVHRDTCKGYAVWVAHNAEAALETRDARGRYGMWWGEQDSAKDVGLPEGVVDYRNDHSLLLGGRWLGLSRLKWSDSIRVQGLQAESRLPGDATKAFVRNTAPQQEWQGFTGVKDPNDRGRGRTVEAHAGGVAVLRCLWALQNLR